MSKLTLDPTEQDSKLEAFDAQVDSALLPQEEVLKDVYLDESQFSQEELAEIEEFASKIDIKNHDMILQYGSAPQKKLADFSDKALENVRSKDLGETGKMLSDMVVELKNFDPNGQNKKGIRGIFNKGKQEIESIQANYAKVSKNVDGIRDQLEASQIKLMKDNALLGQMQELNEEYYKELTMYIMAGKKRLQQIQTTELQELVAKANATNQAIDANAVKDLQAFCDRFEKKLYDLELSRMLSLQTSPQLQVLQSSNAVMIDKIQTTVVNTIPLWKNQMVIALGLDHANRAAQAQRQVSNMTNELLQKNADALHSAAVATAKESNRGIVDLETLKHTNEQLIQTFDEVIQIQEEGREKRKAAETEMLQMENELKQKLREIN